MLWWACTFSISDEVVMNLIFMFQKMRPWKVKSDMRNFAQNPSIFSEEFGNPRLFNLIFSSFLFFLFTKRSFLLELEIFEHFSPCDRSLQEVTGCYITGSVYLFAGGKNKAKGVVLKNSRENIPRRRRRAVTALELLPLCFDDNIHHCKLSLLFFTSKHLITLKLFFLVRPH